MSERTGGLGLAMLHIAVQPRINRWKYDIYEFHFRG